MLLLQRSHTSTIYICCLFAYLAPTAGLAGHLADDLQLSTSDNTSTTSPFTGSHATATTFGQSFGRLNVGMMCCSLY